MQCEIEEAMDQDGKTPRHRSGCHAAPEIVARVSSHKSHAKQINYKEEPDQRADNSTIRQNLQVIVVRLFQPVGAIARIITGVDHAKSAQSGADPWMSLNN